jgi:predicted nucleic acid-binding protein
MCSWISSQTTRSGANGRNGSWIVLPRKTSFAINDIVYAELSVGYSRIEKLDAMIREVGLAAIPRFALFLAGKAYQRYRSDGGLRTGVLPDFFLGAHAVISDCVLITRAAARYRTYFPGIVLIAPN